MTQPPSRLLSAVKRATQHGWSDPVSKEIDQAAKVSTPDDLATAATRLAQLCPKPDAASLTSSPCRTVERLSVQAAVKRNMPQLQKVYDDARLRDGTLEAMVVVHVTTNTNGEPLRVEAKVQRSGESVVEKRPFSQQQAERVLREDIEKIFETMKFTNLSGQPMILDIPIRFHLTPKSAPKAPSKRP
ncbi:MAG: hypothetical protein HY465_01375 [Deltaproteobacteria bacterium]|nr:hypothetical protein [Deltaproteobacteria bacterium]